MDKQILKLRSWNANNLSLLIVEASQWLSHGFLNYLRKSKIHARNFATVRQGSQRLHPCALTAEEVEHQRVKYAIIKIEYVVSLVAVNCFNNVIIIDESFIVEGDQERFMASIIQRSGEYRGRQPHEIVTASADPLTPVYNTADYDVPHFMLPAMTP